MQSTEHFLLNKPDAEDFYNVQTGNDNLDLIDTELHKTQNPQYESTEELQELSSGESVFKALGKLAVAVKNLISHLADKSNPHKVTAEQIGALGVNESAASAKRAAFADMASHAETATSATYDSESNIIADTYATKTELGTKADAEHSHSEYAPTESPVFTGSISMGRKDNTTVGEKSVTFGNKATASANTSFAHGYDVTASGNYSMVHGYGSVASGNYSGAIGYYSEAKNSNSLAVGQKAKASGAVSAALGDSVTALAYQMAIGHYNNTSLATANDYSGTSAGTAFVIGNGTSSAASNAFRVTGEGATYAKAAYNSTGADYAEFAEWADGNPDNEDRRGYFVTFDEEKTNMIRKANEGDYILGIVSGNPCIIGNSDESWLGRYVFDEFGTPVYETTEQEETYFDEETGEEKTRTVEVTFYKLNPDYDPEKEYIHRKDRPEWDYIGWIGVLSVRDDGTCKPGGYCKAANGGTATTAERGTDTYRVLERVTENIIKVAVK